MMPDPHLDGFRLTFEKMETDIQVDVLDVLGRKRFNTTLKQGATEIWIDTEGWPVGLFICQTVDLLHHRNGWIGKVIKN
ncbi:MAG: hypothetical protein ABIQ11_05325 [Saprospiraceae bacterium]